VTPKNDPDEQNMLQLAALQLPVHLFSQLQNPVESRCSLESIYS